jgi:RNAse (barnase) inhibitor barstar
MTPSSEPYPETGHLTLSHPAGVNSHGRWIILMSLLTSVFMITAPLSLVWEDIGNSKGMLLWHLFVDLVLLIDVIKKRFTGRFDNGDSGRFTIVIYFEGIFTCDFLSCLPLWVVSAVFLHCNC